MPAAPTAGEGEGRLYFNRVDNTAKPYPFT
jgi:hypothetical protein